MSGEREWWQHEDTGAKRRLRACVEAWPECQEGDYNPSCCRFPKSCSADIYDPRYLTEAGLEPRRPARADHPQAVPQADGLSEEVVANLRVLMEAATPGPWECWETTSGAEHWVSETGRLWSGAVHAPVTQRDDYGKADSLLIAAMRNALPLLLAEADRLAARDRDHEAEMERRLAEVYGFCQARATGAHANGEGWVERQWLDVLHLLDRARTYGAES